MCKYIMHVEKYEDFEVCKYRGGHVWEISSGRPVFAGWLQQHTRPCVHIVAMMKMKTMTDQEEDNILCSKLKIWIWNEICTRHQKNNTSVGAHYCCNEEHDKQWRRVEDNQ